MSASSREPSMRNLLSALLSTVVFAGTAHTVGAQGGPSPERWSAAVPAETTGPERTVVTDGIAHYVFSVRVGPSRFEVIQIHRLVKERSPYQPVAPLDGVFLVTGAPSRFELIFMPRSVSPVPSWDRSVAVFLAQNDLDVWGVTFGWSLTPPDTTDFSFMKGWGLARDSRLTADALSFARGVRGMSGLGFGPIHLLGFSYGVSVVYSVAGEETQWDQHLRSVKGLIPVDARFKSTPGSAHQRNACNHMRTARTMLDAGRYQDDATLFMRSGELALSQPEAVSTSATPLTNYQAALALGDGFFVASARDSSGRPNDLLYTEPPLWIDLLRATPPFTTTQMNYDIEAVECGQPDVPFDDHLGEIAVPILYVGAVAGFAEDGVFTTTLTASRDVTKIIVNPPGFAHADLFLARDAEKLVWKPILDWIKAHR